MIKPSELIINEDKTLFHLHIDESFVADNVIIVGDPDRSDLVASFFDKRIKRAQNREFVTNYGIYNNTPITVISSGIGCDNIDIVMTELDAAVNVDLDSREIKSNKRKLNIIRLGTSGGLQNDILVGDYIISEYSIGIDGLAHFYGNSKSVREIDFEDDFVTKTGWLNDMAKPYVIKNSEELACKFDKFAKRGVTISAGGFYAPQGRVVRLPLWKDDYINCIEKYSFKNKKITNFEMESSAIALLCRMLGHNSITVCAIIAQRIIGNSNPNYKEIVNNLITKSLQVLTK